MQTGINSKGLSLNELLIFEKERVNWDHVILDANQRLQLENLIREQRFAVELSSYGLPINNKLLLHGDSGCGKTMVVKALATALGKPLWILDISSVISARIGETSLQLKLIFDRAAKEKVILFIDEFDHIAKSRNHTDKDVGEMRRLVNTLIQLIDYFPQDSILIGATNYLAVIDTALIRRFQLKIGFVLPEKNVLDEYYDQILMAFPLAFREIDRSYDISFAEARDITFTQVKAALLSTLDQTLT